MRSELLRLLRWWLLAAALLVAAGAGAAPPVLRGLAIGLLVGSAYVWLLARRTRTTAGLPQARAVAAAQVGGAARMVFVLLAFGLAFRAWPDAGLPWCAAAFFLPVIVRLVALARGVDG